MIVEMLTLVLWLLVVLQLWLSVHRPKMLDVHVYRNLGLGLKRIFVIGKFWIYFGRGGRFTLWYSYRGKRGARFAGLLNFVHVFYVD